MIKRKIIFFVCFLILVGSFSIIDVEADVEPYNENGNNETTAVSLKEKVNNIDTNSVINTKKNTKETEEFSSVEVENLNSVIKESKEKLEKTGNSVENELKKQIDNYKNMLSFLETQEESETNSEKMHNIKSLIANLQVMLSEYLEYENGLNNENVSHRQSVQPYAVAMDPTALLSLSFPAAHAAIVSYFSDEGYTLAAELLTYMKTNTSYDSIYRPVNSNIVINSQVFQDLVNRSSQRGSGEFERDSDTNKQDLYMAIHAFSYSKSINNTAIILTDRYDFAFNDSYDDFFTQAAVNMMFSAQEKGYLTPYYVIVESANTINTNNNSNEVSFPINNWKYSEIAATLGKGESVIFNLSFNASGYRNIQTFGYNDAYLTLQSSNGSSLVSNDDSGYARNAFLQYYFSAGVSYRLVLRLYAGASIGNVRVAITPSAYSSYDNINSLERTKNLIKTYYKKVEVNNAAGQVSMFTLKPATSSSYTIETTKKDKYVDTYLILIDPRRADVDRTDNKPDGIKSCRVNDDGGENLQAKISVGKHDNDVPYLIIASTYSSGISGNFYFSIKGLDTSHFIFL